MVNRRELLKGCALMGATAIIGDAKAYLTKGAVGGRSILQAQPKSNDDAYYR